jgi:hypothetical protein
MLMTPGKTSTSARSAITRQERAPARHRLGEARRLGFFVLPIVNPPLAVLPPLWRQAHSVSFEATV